MANYQKVACPLFSEPTLNRTYKVKGEMSIHSTVSQNISTAVALAIYPAISGSPTINSLYGLWIYANDIGTATVSCYAALSLGMKVSNQPTTSTFMRIYNHTPGGADYPHSVMWFANSGGGVADYLFDFEGQIEPLAVATGETLTPVYKIKIKVGDNDYYIHAGTSA